MSNPYILQKANKSYCPRCEETVDLLCKKYAGAGPMFYICWNCENIFEAGKGQVLRDE